jgi:hypothetical protein
MLLRIIAICIILTGFCIRKSLGQEKPAYPKVTGYLSVIHPLFTSYPDEIIPNFRDSYVVGFPSGINILKSDKIGFSFEITPFVRDINGKSKVTTFLFHPGVLFRFKHGFTIAERLAFETSGRYGFTTIFSKIIVKGKNANLFLASPIPVRFGNDTDNSIGMGLQVGVSF